jgi:adenylate cyclase
VVAGAEYAALAAWILRHAPPADASLARPADHLVKAGVLVLSGILAGGASSRLRTWIGKSFAMLEERKRTLDRFGQFVSPAVAAKLLDQKDLGSEVRHVCVMFLDIRDFTSFSEKRGPEEVVRYLNSLFGFMIDAVNAHNGIINKFLGDGFMAVFGAPLSDGGDCNNAVLTAREIVAGVEALVAKGAIPPTRVGIGLHTGPAVTGVVGTATRGEYTVIGDVVNLASRIESLNKEFGSCLLVSDEVLAAIGGDRPADAVGRGRVKVKGREAPVQIFQLG